MNEKQFQEACDKVIGLDRERKQIGTLGEKSVHAVLKHYLEPDTDKHEIKIDGYFADIYNDSGIIEIQTRGFHRLRNKLKTFLPKEKVTIVYPIPRHTWLYWINEETGEVSKRRKSPKLGKPYMIFPELYKIKNLLENPNLDLHLVLLDMEEYRILDGWSHDKKKGATKFDRIPTAVVEEIRITSPEEYDFFLPEHLGEAFTSQDYRSVIKMPLRNAQVGLHLLHYMGRIERIGKEGRYHLYQKA